MKARNGWLAIGLSSALIFCGSGDGAAQGPEGQEVPAPVFGGAPVVTRYNVAPELRNREEVRRALVANYPRALKEAGAGGTTLVWMLIDETGELMSARIRSPSGHPALDAAALRVASRMRFTPGLLDGSPVKVWLSLPIIFRTIAGPPAPPARPRFTNPYVVAPLDAPEAPQAIPLPTSPPSLLNGNYVYRQLKAAYERRFGGTGVRGQTTLRLRVDAAGNAVSAEVRSSSGNPALDTLALSMREMLVFVPGLRRGRYAEETAELEMKVPPKP